MSVLADTLEMLPALLLNVNKIDSLRTLWIHIPIYKDSPFYLYTKKT